MIKDLEFGPYGPGDTEETAKVRRWIVETLRKSGPLSGKELADKAYEEIEESHPVYGFPRGQHLTGEIWRLIGGKKLDILWNENKFKAT